jgi:hypothetical protein
MLRAAYRKRRVRESILHPPIRVTSAEIHPTQGQKPASFKRLRRRSSFFTERGLRGEICGSHGILDDVTARRDSMAAERNQ